MFVYIAVSNMSAFSGALTMALTDEEEYLLERYKILRDKKRALQKLKEKVETKIKPAVKREAQDTSKTPEDAKKKAEMLVASGHIKIAKTSIDREFKRARTSEKKVVREPLSDHETSVKAEKRQSAKISAMKEIYNSRFVKGGRNDDETESSYEYPGYREQRKGNTIFIKGCGLKEDIVNTEFNRFGTVLEVRFEKHRSHGFVAFKTCEEAEKAIDEMNGTIVSGINIEVSLARRQLHSEGIKGTQCVSRDFPQQDHHEKITEVRELQKYNDEFF